MGAIRNIAFAALAAAALGAASAQTLSVSPNPAPADKPFTLTLAGLYNGCYASFGRESVFVSGSRIDLRYTRNDGIVVPMGKGADASVVDPICPVLDTLVTRPNVGPVPVGPVFSMPALKAGKYEVWATDVPECVYSGCKIGLNPVSAGVLEVKAQGTMTFTLSPASAPAGQGFDLQLLSYGFTCATEYLEKVVHVQGNLITLSFFHQERPDVGCIALYQPYGPVFRMPPLAAGSYEVRVDRNAMNASLSAGTLVITGPAKRTGWYLKQPTTQADAPFVMQLLKDSLMTCTNFSHATAAASTGGIQAAFLMQQGKCASISTAPIGPAFAMPALKTGIYPVYVTELLPCEVTAPFCAVDREMPVPSDTLVVIQTLAVRMSALRAGASKVELRGKVACFDLPQGKAGIWKAELLTLDGRVLGESAFNAAPGERVSVPVARAPANAVSLLRLTAPGGVQSFLPVAR